MATEPETDADQPGEPMPCAPCRGTGRLTSNLGGSPHEVECPWCDGSGSFTPGHDAQAARRGDDASADAAHAS